jgi:pilus assembly protein CpaC
MSSYKKPIMPNGIRRVAVALLVCAATVGFGSAANAQNSATQSRVIQVTAQPGGVPQRLSLSLNKAAILELDRDARDVVIANPEIVDAVVRTPRRIFVLSLAVGRTNAIFLDGEGRHIATVEIAVNADVDDLNDYLRRDVPNTSVSATGIDNSVVLSGEVASLREASIAQQAAAQTVEEPEQVVNNVAIMERQQVLIKVRVAEMTRSIAKQFGINPSAIANVNGVPVVASTGNQFSLLGRALSDISGTQFGQVCDVWAPQNPVISPNGTPTFIDEDGTWHFLEQNIFPVGSIPGQTQNPLGILPGEINLPGSSLGFSATSLCSARPNNIQGIMQALERTGLVRTLAEPNLTAISGENARFLAGGEFPVPVSRDRDGNITVEFKPFGVGLAFTPVVLSRGRISLQLSTEVSELTNAGALTLGGGQVSDSNGNTINIGGVTLPALQVRRTETTVELPSGGSLAIGGLIQQQTKQNIDAFPGVKELPVLGALFRSRDFQNNETELVVTVTAYLVDPVAESQLATPDQGYSTPTDLETILFGRLNAVQQEQQAAEPSPAAVPQGTVGYIVQ